MEEWGDFLPLLNHTKVLEKGLFSFIFYSGNMVDKVLELQWSMDGVPLFMKCWDPLFYAKTKKVDLEPLWV